MSLTVKILILSFTFHNILTDNNSVYDSHTNSVTEQIQNVYMGEKFPTKYLVAEDYVPTVSDLNKYLNHLKLTIDYFSRSPNRTDGNKAIGLFYTKALLKRVLQDDGHKLQKHHQDIILEIIRKAEYVVSHFIYITRLFGWLDLEFRVSRLFKDDTAQVYSIQDFNRNRLKKWILNKGVINDFIEVIDDATLPKEKYAELVNSMSDYYIDIETSDECLSRVVYNPEPIDLTELRPCHRDEYCKEHTHSSPSIAYSLSHRLLNIMIRRQMKRCYMISKEKDDLHMEILCSFMYREVVYLARRGFFARDIFLEHIALCGMFGYEEFFRRHWFRKAISWMDDQGCMTEFMNFEINRTDLYIKRAGDNWSRVKVVREDHKITVNEECQDHPMALLAIVLAHAIRHAAHFMPLILS